MSYKKLGINLSASEMFLCAVLSHIDHQDCNKINSLYYEIGDEVIFSICKHNNIESIAAHALLKCVKSDKLPKKWMDAYEIVDKRISIYMLELDRVASLLLNYQIHMVALLILVFGALLPLLRR